MYITRLKQKVRDVDFPLMIQEIAEAGYTAKDIAEITGANQLNIQNVKQDRFDAATGWKESIRLVDMYLRVTHKNTLPFI
jgi:hypothetical protein